MNEPIPAHSQAEPGGKKSSRWLNVDKLSRDLYEVNIMCRDIKLCVIDDARENPPLLPYSQARQIGLRKEATLLSTLRALHRGKRHTIRRRVFGPDYAGTNGTAIIETPVPIPQWMLDKYALNHPPEPLPGTDEAA